MSASSPRAASGSRRSTSAGGSVDSGTAARTAPAVPTRKPSASATGRIRAAIIGYKTDVRIGVTLGDPCGIGPEVVARALHSPPLGVEVDLFGDRGVLERAGGVPPGVRLHEVTALATSDAVPGH